MLIKYLKDGYMLHCEDEYIDIKLWYTLYFLSKSIEYRVRRSSIKKVNKA